MHMHCPACDNYFSLAPDTEKPRCPRCMRRTDLRKVESLPVAGAAKPSGARWLAWALSALIFGGGAAAYMVYQRMTAPPLAAAEPVPFDEALATKYAAARREVDQLTSQLENEPCDQTKGHELIQKMVRAGDYRSATERGLAFVSRCGEHRGLRMLLHRAFMQLTEPARAVEQASKILEQSPSDSNAFGLRAMAYEKAGDQTRAEEDYSQALLLDPTLTDVPVALADLRERTGRPCEAIEPLEHAAQQHPDAGNIQTIRARIELLLARPECSELLGVGKAVLRRAPGATAIPVHVKLNGRVSADFIVDTGATQVVVPKSLATRLGLKYEQARKIQLETANGVTTGRYVMLERIDVQGASASRVPAIVMDNLATSGGLLGLSFLSRFDMQQKGSTLTLAARGSAK